MLKCQRHLFDIPNDVAYFNTAYMSPLLTKVVEEVDRGIRLKSQPWNLKTSHFFDEVNLARKIFSSLMHCSHENIALVPSASYGIETAAKNIKLKPNNVVIVLEDQFPSNVYAWRRSAQKSGAMLKKVKKKEGVAITDCILNEMDEKCAVVSIPHVLWTSGICIDLLKIRNRCNLLNAKLVLDLTQSAGAFDFDFSAIKPDFAVVANYKWMLGPYSTGFLYVSPDFCTGEPLEEGWITKEDSKDFSTLVDYKDEYEAGAVRYDVGERANFALVPGVVSALEQISAWGVRNIEDTLRIRNKQLCRRLEKIGLSILADEDRGPHYVCAKLPSATRKDFLDQLAKKNIYISERGGFLRITPHLWNDQNDFDQLIEGLSSSL